MSFKKLLPLTVIASLAMPWVAMSDPQSSQTRNHMPPLYYMGAPESSAQATETGQPSQGITTSTNSLNNQADQVATVPDTSAPKEASNSGSATTSTSSAQSCTCQSVVIFRNGKEIDCCGNVLSGPKNTDTSAAKKSGARTATSSTVTGNQAALDSGSPDDNYDRTLP